MTAVKTPSEKAVPVIVKTRRQPYRHIFTKYYDAKPTFLSTVRAITLGAAALALRRKVVAASSGPADPIAPGGRSF
jgi:hypothetical protein